MQVILIEAVNKLGKIGDIRNVANGYARYYLLPRKKAIRATEENKSIFEQKRKTIEEENIQKKLIAQQKHSNLENLEIIIIRQAADDGRLYGSVSTKDIANTIKIKSGIEIDSELITINERFKSLGIYEIEINLHAEVRTKLLLSIARSEEEAKSSLIANSKLDKNT